MIKLDPSTGVRIVLDAHRADARCDPIPFDVEFAEMGGEGATPYEVLLHAALVGQTTRFTRQDAIEQTWRIMQPLLDAPPPVHVYAPGSWGRTRPTLVGARPLERPLDRDVSGGGADGEAPRPQSAAAPSPFPPIADYAFLSNCHTGALVAPDGGIGWLCVPRFDSPSVFGNSSSARRGTSDLAPTGSTTRRLDTTSPARMSS